MTTPSTSPRRLVVAVLLRDRTRAWTARDIARVIAQRGYRVPPHAVAGELERLFREGAVRRGREGRRVSYRLVALPQKTPGTMARLNHLRRTWRQSDSCARKGAALRALHAELTELSTQPVRNKSGDVEQRARLARNRRYRSELTNKTEETRAFCQRADV